MSFLSDPDIKWGPALRYHGLLLGLCLLGALVRYWLDSPPLPDWVGGCMVLAYLVAGWVPILRMSRNNPT